jgi:hypothetical protein
MELEKPKINLRDVPTIKCDNCGGVYFREVGSFQKSDDTRVGGVCCLDIDRVCKNYKDYCNYW